MDDRGIVFKSNFLEVRDHQDDDAKISNNGFWFKTATTEVGFSTKFLLEDFNLVVLEKFECEYRKKSKKSIVVLVQLLLQKIYEKKLNRIQFSNCKGADFDLDERIRNYGYGETTLRLSRRTFLWYQFPGTFGLSRLWCMDQYQKILKRNLPYRTGFHLRPCWKKTSL